MAELIVSSFTSSRFIFVFVYLSKYQKSSGDGAPFYVRIILFYITSYFCMFQGFCFCKKIEHEQSVLTKQQFKTY